MGDVVKRERIEGVRLSVQYEGKDREMAYALVRDGKLEEGAIHLYPPSDGTAVNLHRLAAWSKAVLEAVRADEAGGEEGQADG